MLFRTKSGASRITFLMGLPDNSPEAKVLIRLIDWSAKETDRMLRAMRKPALPRAEGELGAAVAMARNTSAVAEVARVLRVDTGQARRLLARCRDAAAALASEADLIEIVSTARRDREAAAGEQNSVTELEAAIVHCAAEATVREQELRAVVQADEMVQIIRSTCKKHGFTPTVQDEEVLLAAVGAIAGSDVIKSMIKRWVQEGSINIAPADINAVRDELEREVAEFMKTRQ